MTESFQNKKAMLIGNGVNRLDPDKSISWGELLTELKNKYSINVDLCNFFKPFPIAFDELQHLKPSDNCLRSKLKNLNKNNYSIACKKVLNRNIEQII